MRLIFIFSLCFLFVSVNMNAQSYGLEWGHSFGIQGTHKIRDIKLDGGFIYATGSFKGVVDFNPDPNQTEIRTSITNGADIYLAKFDTLGSLVWVRAYGGSANNSEFGEKISVDNNGNIIVVGYHGPNAEFMPGPGSLILNNFNNKSKVFVLKTDDLGNTLWAKSIPTNHSFTITSGIPVNLALDDSNFIYINSSYVDTTDFDLGPGVFNMGTFPGGRTNFYLKLDSSGDFQWVRQLQSSIAQMYSGSIAYTHDNSLILIGGFGGNTDFDFSSVINMETAIGYIDAFICKIGTDGSFKWVKTYGESTYSNGALDLALDSIGNMHIFGVFEDTLDVDPSPGVNDLVSNGGYDVYVLKLDSAGNFIWGKNLGGTDHDGSAYISSIRAFDIQVDKLGNVYTAACFQQTADIDPGPNMFNIVSNGQEDAFIQKMDASGNFIWGSSFGNAEEYDYLSAIQISNFGNSIYLSAYFKDTVDYNPNAGVSLYNTTLGLIEGFLFKLNSCSNSTATISDTACISYLSPSGNYTWTNSGTYNDTIPNSAGCDSIITLNLVINNASYSTINDTACLSYVSPSTNYTWTSSGSYQDTLINAVGCDNIITINLFITQYVNKTISASACYTYTSPSTNYTWTSSGTYQDTILNTNGCDTALTINLSLIGSNFSTIFPYACYTYTSPSANYTWSTTGIYKDTLINSQGCDSIITINLNIHDTSVVNITNGLGANTSIASVQWLDCDNNYAIIPGATSVFFYPSTSGNYAVEVTNGNCIDTSGCHSYIATSLNDIEKNVLSIFPNPTHKNIDIVLRDPEKEISIELLNMQGQLLLKKEYTEAKNLSLDLSTISSGVYLIKLQAANWSGAVKVEKK